MDRAPGERRDARLVASTGEGEPRLVVPDEPVLAGDEVEVAVVVGEPPRCVATDQVGSLSEVGPSESDQEFRLWARSASHGPGWAPLEGPWLEGVGRAAQPVTFRVPDVLATGRWLMDVTWIRHDFLKLAAGQRVSGTAQGIIDVVGPTGTPVVVQETPSLELAGDAAGGDEFSCTLVGTMRGRLPLLESIAVLELREPQGWQRVAALFASSAGRPPNWQPAGKGRFGYDPDTAQEQVFQLPPDLPTGEYRVAIRYKAEPAVDHVETGDPGFREPPSTSTWCGLLRRSFRIDGPSRVSTGP